MTNPFFKPLFWSQCKGLLVIPFSEGALGHLINDHDFLIARTTNSPNKIVVWDVKTNEIIYGLKGDAIFDK